MSMCFEKISVYGDSSRSFNLNSCALTGTPDMDAAKTLMLSLYRKVRIGLVSIDWIVAL